MMALIAAAWLVNWIVAPRAIAGSLKPQSPGLEIQFADRWIRVSLAVLAVLGTAMAVGLPLVVDRWAPGEPGFAWLGMILAIGAATALVLEQRHRRAASAGALFITAGAFFIGMFAVAGPRFSTRQTSLQMSDAVGRLSTPETSVAIYRAYLPGLIYYADRRQPITNIRAPADCERLVGAADDFLIITDVAGLIELRPYLPVDAVVLESQMRFLKGTELVVVGRQAALAKTASVDGAPAAASTSRESLRR
jgi:hypothetical protein